MTDREQEAAEVRPNGDLHVTDHIGRQATLHWSRFHGLIVSSDDAAVYLGQPEVYAWLAENLTAHRSTEPPADVREALACAFLGIDPMPLDPEFPRHADALAHADIVLARFRVVPLGAEPDEDTWEYAQAVEEGEGEYVVRKALRSPGDLDEGYVLMRRPDLPWEPVNPRGENQ